MATHAPPSRGTSSVDLIGNASADTSYAAPAEEASKFEVRILGIARAIKAVIDVVERNKKSSLLLSWCRKLFVCAVYFMVLYTILTTSMLPYGNFFALFWLYVCAMAAGEIAVMINVPPLTLMLIVGIAFRQVHPITDGLQSAWSKALRKYAYSIIFLRAGFGIDLRHVLRNGPKMTIVLAVIAPLIESLVAGGVAVGLLNVSYTWGLLLGFVLSDVSPAVTVPILLDFTKRKLGTLHGLPSLLLLGGTVNAVVSITAFYFILGILPEYASGSVGLGAARIILEILCGFGVGAFVAVFVGVFFRSRDALDQTFYLLTASVALIFASDYIGYPGGGTLAVLTTGALSGPMVRKTRHVVEAKLKWMWLWTGQPLLFSLVGALVSFNQMHSDAIWKGVIIIAVGLTARACATYSLVRFIRTPFTRKEAQFITLTWCAKATVQAALAPVALDYANSHGLSSEATGNALDVLTIGLLSIVLTAPATSWGMQKAGPLWLEPELEPTLADTQSLPPTLPTLPAVREVPLQLGDVLGSEALNGDPIELGPIDPPREDTLQLGDVLGTETLV